jgi:uncharacterized protein DUF4157/OmpA family protein
METQAVQKKLKPTVMPGKRLRTRLNEVQPINVQSILHANRIQPKLQVGQPNDKYEQEADRVAEQVMRMPAPQPFSSVSDSSLTNSTKPGLIQRACAACSGEFETAENESRPVKPTNLCPKCQTQEKGLIQTKQITPLVQRQESLEDKEDETLIQTKTNGNVTPEVTPAIGADIQSLQGGGQPLSKSERGFFEPRIGVDFGHVRVHPGKAKLARNINARAFTVNNHIVFGQGEYTPNSDRSRRLMAHELIHVVQQTGAGRSAKRQANTVQRQTVPIPVFDEFDPCLIVPENLPSPLDMLGGQKVCGSHAKKIREFLSKKKGKKKILCPPGFIAGTAKGFEGTCCKISGYTTEGREKVPYVIHSKKTCCEPAQIAAKSSFPICCPPGTRPDQQRKNCVKPKPVEFKLKPCPEDREMPYLYCACTPQSRINLKTGVCCPEGQEGKTGKCETPTSKPNKPQPVKHNSEHVVSFKVDRPFSWETGATGLKNSLTGTGPENLQKMIKLLKDNPSYSVQLFGRASPEGSVKYNMALSKRRAKIILKALLDAGIVRSRIVDPKDWSASEGCGTVESGVISCGEAGASGPSDRQVLANVFSSG